ncbi:RutC family protein UK114 [Gryllus bimaculatus]|nr:RutC family protein UK114 [Gryllus bimaculatus]
MFVRVIKQSSFATATHVYQNLSNSSKCKAISEISKNKSTKRSVNVEDSALKMCTLERKIISTPNAPQPVAPYHQAVQVGHTLYLSGVLGLDKDTNKLINGDTAAEAEKALTNMGHILEAASTSFQNEHKHLTSTYFLVVKTTIFLADIADFAAVNEVYKKFFKEPFPARSAFQVGKLPLDAKVEIEAIAVVGTIKNVL